MLPIIVSCALSGSILLLNYFSMRFFKGALRHGKRLPVTDLYDGRLFALRYDLIIIMVSTFVRGMLYGLYEVNFPGSDL